ncbi:hypothetical protein HA402_005637 [Bradysia odoriphaga]|nr:hypothetical protein HA402_005637 [Bradysia odoriphaga]
MEIEIKFSSDQNDTASAFVHYGSEYILNTEVPQTATIIVIYSVVAVALITIWYFLFVRPFDWNRDFSDLGFDDVKAKYPNVRTQKLVIESLRRRKRVEDMPPVYPNGWFIILETDNLPKRATKEVSVLGLNLLAWRGGSRKSYVTDAYCSDLEADLSVEGQVNGEHIEYYAKGWRLTGSDGKLRKISSPSDATELATVKLWDTMEMNGFIYLWYHADGECPDWRPPIFSQIESGQWKYRGRSEFKVACHIQEIPENGADVAHLNVVHKPAMFTGGKPTDSVFKWSFLKHVWSASWAANEQLGQEHQAVMKVHHHMSVFDKISLMSMDVEAHQIGPGLVFLEFNGFFGKGILFFMVTPLEPLMQKITHRFYSSNSMLHPFGMLILLGEAIQLERDIAIWNRKTFINRPLLTKEDKAIKSFRRWFSQFYTENSPKYHYH